MNYETSFDYRDVFFSLLFCSPQTARWVPGPPYLPYSAVLRYRFCGLLGFLELTEVGLKAPDWISF